MASSVERYCFFCNRKELFSVGQICTGCGSSQEENVAAIKRHRQIPCKMVRNACEHCTSTFAFKESDECLSCVGCSTKTYRIKQVVTDRTVCDKCGNKLIPGVAVCVYCWHGEEGVDED